MKEPLKILFISQEIKPYLPDSEIANVCREFPQYVQEQGCEIRTFMPCYGHINERRNQLHEVQRLSGMNLILDDTDHPLIIKVASIQAARMQVYFIDNEDYFTRRGVVADEDGVVFEDNDERAIFYVRGVLETIKKLRWTPDVICCSGWITSIAPLYIKKVYSSDPFFADSKVVYFLHDDKFDGKLRQGMDKKVRLEGIEEEEVDLLSGENVDCDSLKKIAVEYSDAIIIGTKTINDEVQRYVEKKGLPLLTCSPDSEGYRTEYLGFIRGLV